MTQPTSPAPSLRRRPSIFTKWSHRHPLHQLLVQIFNRAASWVPFNVKYGVAMKLRRRRPPYSLISRSAVVVQVGAPRDTLEAGRSRGMSFALLTAPAGRVLVLEPDAGSAARFRKLAERNGLRHVTVRVVAAWSEPSVLTLQVNDAHPATNFTVGCADYKENQVAKFRTVKVQANCLDNILQEEGINQVELVSITTNGAEKEILQGMKAIMESGVRLISLAQTGPKYVELMADHGFRFLSYDDRGYTFQRDDDSRRPAAPRP